MSCQQTCNKYLQASTSPRPAQRCRDVWPCTAGRSTNAASGGSGGSGAGVVGVVAEAAVVPAVAAAATTAAAAELAADTDCRDDDAAEEENFDSAAAVMAASLNAVLWASAKTSSVETLPRSAASMNGVCDMDW